MIKSELFTNKSYNISFIFLLYLSTPLQLPALDIECLRYDFSYFLQKTAFKYFYPGQILISFSLISSVFTEYEPSNDFSPIFNDLNPHPISLQALTNHFENYVNNNGLPSIDIPNTIFPYLQTLNSLKNSNNNTFICFDPGLRMIMYFTAQNQLANLISLLQNCKFLKRKKSINAYAAANVFSKTLDESTDLTATSEEPVPFLFQSLQTQSNLDSWIYAGSPNSTNVSLLYPILTLAQSNVAMQILLENGASPNFLGYSPALSKAPQSEGEYDWNNTPFRCNSTLLYAIQQNNIYNARILLSYGADPNLANGGLIIKLNDNTTSTPYLYATTNSASSQMINLLQQFGGGKQFSAQATSDLQEAIKSANVAQIQSSFQQNANINAPIVFENEEMSILQYIILQPESYPKYNILNTLFDLTKSIAVNFRSSNTGTTALMAAICIQDIGKVATCNDCTGMTEIDAIIKLLIQNGADPFAMNSNQISPYQVIVSKLNNMSSSNKEYNSLTQKLILLINNMDYTLLTIGYYLYNLSLVSLAEKLNTNLTITQSSNVSAVANTAQYKNLITKDKPTLKNIITIIKSFPAQGNWNLMRTEVDILKAIILNYLKLGGSFGALYNGDTILSAAQSTHNNHLVNWIKSNFGNILTFINAVNTNNISQITTSLSDHVPVDTIINSNGDTALIYACSKSHSAMVNILLKHKANANFENSLGQTPLTIVALNNNYDLAQLILSYGANINYKNKRQETLLSQCIQANNIDCLNFLIKNKADINLPINTNKDTALIYACLNKNNNLITTLLNGNADTNIANDSVQTALLIAIQNNNYNIATLLAKHGANFNFKNHQDKPILIACINSINPDFTKLLISNNGDIHSPINSNNDTVLIYACNKNNYKSVKLLLQANANTNIANSSGEIPLSIAINNNNYSLAELLLQHGADINFVYHNTNGTTILLTEFILKNNINAVKFLIKNKAKISNLRRIGDFLFAIYNSNKIFFNALLSAAINSNQTLPILADSSTSNIWNISYNNTTLGNAFYLHLRDEALYGYYGNYNNYNTLPEPIQNIVCNLNSGTFPNIDTGIPTQINCPSNTN